MREIKFRAWHKQDKKMYIAMVGEYPRVYTSRPEGKYMNWSILDKKELDIMQYTGLKDKNGKEIYEGDIVKDKDGNIGKVDFEIGCFWLNNIMEYKDCVERNERSYMVEVIGNIYENPELLTN